MAELSTSPDFLFDLQTSKYFNVAGLTVWVLDYCLSFDLEVQWIWHRKWTFVRLVFTASRYLPFIGAIMTAFNALQMRTGNCNPFNLSSNIFHFLGILSAEGLLAVRIYALWKCNKALLVGMLGCGLFSIAGAIIVPCILHQTDSIDSCAFLGYTIYAVQYAFVLFFECFLLFMTMLSSFKHYRFAPQAGGLINIVIRDGVMYMGCIIFVSTNNIVVNVAAPVGFTNLLDALQLVLHSVLASRIFFHLRESSSCFDNEPAEISTLSFSSSKFEEDDDFGLPMGETAITFNVSSSFKIGDRKRRRNTYTTATVSM